MRPYLISRGLQVEEFATAELTALAESEVAPASDAADASNGSEVTAFAILLAGASTSELHWRFTTQIEVAWTPPIVSLWIRCKLAPRPSDVSKGHQLQHLYLSRKALLMIRKPSCAATAAADVRRGGAAVQPVLRAVHQAPWPHAAPGGGLRSGSRPGQVPSESRSSRCPQTD